MRIVCQHVTQDGRVAIQIAAVGFIIQALRKPSGVAYNEPGPGTSCWGPCAKSVQQLWKRGEGGARRRLEVASRGVKHCNETKTDRIWRNEDMVA